MKKIFYLFFLLFISLQGFGQITKENAFRLTQLDSVLIKNVDSIYVLDTGVNSIHFNTPIIYLLKKDNYINLFEYGIDIMDMRKVVPGLSKLLTYRIKDFIMSKRLRKLDQFFRMINLS